MVLQHPVTTEYHHARTQIETSLMAIRELDISCLWFWPNVDAGSDGTSKGIRSFREKYPDSKIHFFKNMEPRDFLKLLLKSKCLIGNSSVGIREASFLGIPVVDIGGRQAGRLRGKHARHVEYNQSEIQQAIQFQIENGFYQPEYLYGDGHAGERIASALSEMPLRYDKKISY